ncbi:hypothetical protein [Myroides sp. WP-1]|uniref:hypothetical protein n=1 Tax=Myroides sp. WP-1 TaxID=2759944 RepID=UPI0015FE107C|nr:hypothetical protein [Myroides sp. WP-1]MBB1139708.1 hypothetical protein [Myroides sp. WP-1]
MRQDVYYITIDNGLMSLDELPQYIEQLQKEFLDFSFQDFFSEFDFTDRKIYPALVSKYS